MKNVYALRVPDIKQMLTTIYASYISSDRELSPVVIIEALGKHNLHSMHLNSVPSPYHCQSTSRMNNTPLGVLQHSVSYFLRNSIILA
jgi:hypothetical protein